MTVTAAYPSSGPMGALRRAEGWLDRKGKAAWIAAMVLGFIFFWPVGLALLAYMIWGKQMFGKSCRNHGADARRAWTDKWTKNCDYMSRTARPSGNAAFDAYKTDTLRRLEEEQEAFEAFLQRLRDAKDKTEFDAFMDDRARRSTTVPSDSTAQVTTTPSESDPRRGQY